jgi:phospholipid/cholesterol/gamma-HCH transport system substrate-binding protein
METKANYVAVGVFVMALVLGLVIALLWLTGAQYAQEYAYYQTFFSGSVSGLGNGTSVRYNGIEVGRVAKLNFDPVDPKRVQVLMQIDPTLKIHSDSVASIASQGLTGGSYVEIDGGTKNAPVLTPHFWGEYPTIRSKPSAFQQLEQSAPQLVVKLNHAADQLNDVLNAKNRKAISAILTKLDGVLGDLRKTTGVLSARSNDIDATLRNFNTASAKLNTDLADVHSTLGNADKALGSINTAATGIGKLADHADNTIASAQVGQLSSDIRNLISNLNHLSNQLEREPTRLLFGDRREGYTPK